MLELHDPAGAFETLESYLGEHLRQGFAADVFLGYGLSSALRRDATPPPPEPCRLPLAACRIRPERPQGATWNAAACRVGAWEETWSDADHAAAVDEVRAAIGRGNVYQVNLVRHLSAPFSGDPASLAVALAPLRPLQPRPLAGEGWTVVS